VFFLLYFKFQINKTYSDQHCENLKQRVRPKKTFNISKNQAQPMDNDLNDEHFAELRNSLARVLKIYLS
jgi:hypothetical protein